MKKVALVLGLALAASFVLAGCSASETGGAGDPVPDGVTEPGVTPNGNEIEAGQPANQVQDTEEKLEWDKMPMVMVDGKLYYDTGEESSIDGRCGVMDGEITSTVDSSEIPAKDNQSNFGAGFEYQYGANDTIEIFMNGKWIVFEHREGA